jgi:hypothetical protein
MRAPKNREMPRRRNEVLVSTAREFVTQSEVNDAFEFTLSIRYDNEA